MKEFIKRFASLYETQGGELAKGLNARISCEGFSKKEMEYLDAVKAFRYVINKENENPKKGRHDVLDGKTLSEWENEIFAEINAFEKIGENINVRVFVNEIREISSGRRKAHG